MRPLLRTKSKLSLARVASRMIVLGRQALRRGSITRVRRRGLWWELDLVEGIDLAIYLLGGFETTLTKVYRRILRPGSIVLDIGANIGAHTLPLARCVGPEGIVIAFEPTDFALAKLRRNLELNPELAPIVVPVQALLSGPKTTEARHPVFSSWPLLETLGVHPLHGGRAMSTRGAEITTLDSALRRRNITKVDLIKIDVDGHEPEILEGAADTIRSAAPTILMELAPYVLEECGCSVEDLLCVIDSLGYRLFHLGSEAPLLADGSELRARIPPGASVNIVAKRVVG